MKFYSEKLKKMFDTPEALVEAENIHDAEQAENESTKKELAQKIEAAEQEVEHAYKLYEDVKKEAEEFAKDANKKIKEQLQKAYDVIERAEVERAEAIKAFNSKFGTYKAVYTGDRAEKEAQRIRNIIDAVFSMNSWF